MSTSVVFQQMIVILLLMATGYIIFKKKFCDQTSCKDISFLIANVCNPALIISSALDENTTATRSDLLLMFGIVVVIYALLIFLGIVLPKLLKVKKEDQKFYNLMAVYGNIGFVGIPVVSAVIGPSAVIYVTIFILIFNLLVYTHGIFILAPTNQQRGGLWKKVFNIGTLASVSALLIFWFEIPVPAFLADGFSYAGRSTTFLSILMLGAALAQMPILDIFKEPKLYVFFFVRLLVIPIGVVMFLKTWVDSEMIINVCAIVLGMPAANLPLMMAKQYEMECEVMSKGILLSTILSIVTITIISLFL